MQLVVGAIDLGEQTLKIKLRRLAPVPAMTSFMSLVASGQWLVARRLVTSPATDH